MSLNGDTANLLTEIERRVAVADPAAFLVSERILRRVIKYHRHPVSFGLRVPHYTNYVIERTALLAIVEGTELPLNGRAMPATAILILRPEPDEVAELGLAGTLLRCWRFLFHARVHLALEQKIADGKLSAPEVEKRIASLGLTEFEEAVQVLGQEHLLLPPRTEQNAYVEFAASYLDLRHFAPSLAAHYFPALGDENRVAALLAVDVDVTALLAETRPEGAADLPPREPVSKRVEVESDRADPREARAPAAVAALDPDTLVLQANRVVALGNVVRAAILRTAAASRFQGKRAEQLTHEARYDLYRLVQRLQDALGFPDLEAVQWRELLPVLLPRAARGMWTPEARFLYDLQQVCIDHEREKYSVDLVKWLVALGRLPLKRPLPGHREVLMVKHLRGAARLLASLRLSDADRVYTSQLLAATVRRSEERLRAHFRPLLEAALNDVELLPANVPEQVARHKLIEELLDEIREHGFLNMSDLRDALSRNQLKLPDLKGPWEFLVGDRLIRLNRRLASTLDGVYHAGEIYRRWLQRLSSLAFGNRVGRLLTRYVALPFGGAFVLVEGIGHLWELVQKVVGEGAAHAETEHKSFASPWAILLVGCFILGLLYVPPFRRGVMAGLGFAGRLLRAIFVDVPAWVIRLPITRPLWLVLKTILKPLVPAAVAAEVGVLAGLAGLNILWLAAAVFVAAVLFLYSRWGRDFQESCADWFVRGWQRFSLNLVPGLLRFIIDFFKRGVDLIERVGYAGDELFRFKTGEHSFMLVIKAVFGVVWFLITYVVRFAINLLIEPQVNPIKHFPVVTVGHKLILPLAIPPGRGQPSALAEPLLQVFPLSVGKANAIAGSIVWGIPGIFGFLVWELKENWRLYRANRAPELRPVMVGSHGETMVRLLRPGFHSGTIPKLFAKLRRAQRRGRRRAARRYLDALHHVEESIARFVERELLEILSHSCAWGIPLKVDHVALATNRIRIEVGHRDRGEASLTILFDQSGGRLLAQTIMPLWIDTLSAEQRAVLADALAGFFKLAGADLENPKSFEQYPVFRQDLITWKEWVAFWE